MRTAGRPSRRYAAGRSAATTGCARCARPTIAGLAAAALLCAGVVPAAFAQQPGAGRAAPPPAVVVEKVEVQPVSDPMRFTARIEAIATVDIRARVTGFLLSVAFRDGQAVKDGDVLFLIEPDAFEASVASARAQVARADAARESAEGTLSRNRTLFARNTVSQAVLDDAQAAFDIAAADQQIAEAALNTAELNLSYTRIVAPISGNIGRAMLTEGNLVGPESGTLARIIGLDPIRVAFAVPEGLLVTFRQQAAGGDLVDPDTLELRLRLANGSDYDAPGRVEFVEDEVDLQTGTVTARAIFPNPHHILIPGQFVTLSVQEKEIPSLPVVPQTALLQDRVGRFVYLLGDGNTVAQRRITTGARVGNGWAVTEGLAGGEKIVVQGIQRLADGMTVQPSEGQPLGNGS